LNARQKKKVFLVEKKSAEKHEKAAKNIERQKKARRQEKGRTRLRKIPPEKGKALTGGGLNGEGEDRKRAPGTDERTRPLTKG